MTNPKNISIQNFTYSLPEERIAKYPLTERDASKLLIYKEAHPSARAGTDGDGSVGRAAIEETIYKSIAEHIPENSLLVFNNTKVVAARLLFQKATGGTIEIFCLEPHEQYADITTAMLQKEKVLWQCMVGGASKWKTGQILEKKIKLEKVASTGLLPNSQKIILSASYIEKKIDSFIIELTWNDAAMSFAELLQHAGAIPLPPYLKREVEASDMERYQTVYAEFDGSVAAPTAGLHFTASIFEQLKKKKIKKDFVTLHVGAGTFKPVKSETLAEHDMHAEWIDVSKSTIEIILKNIDNNIIAVGTTSLRTIESLYWLGVKKSGGNNQELGELSQWEAYELEEKKIPVKAALQILLNWMTKNKMERLVTKTQILIAPGYSFKIVKGLITNFHQPQSTLLLLVAALIGKEWTSVYNYALENNFRFLSYGDGCLLWKK